MNMNREPCTPKKIPTLSLLSEEDLYFKSIKAVINESRKLLRRSKIVYVSIFNESYKDIILNWLCNTAQFKGTHSRTLLVSLNDGVCERIRSSWSDVSCVTLHAGQCSHTDIPCPDLAFATLRTKLFLELSKASIRFISIEPDTTWLRDPLVLFSNEYSSKMHQLTFTMNKVFPLSPMKLKSCSIISFQPSKPLVIFLRELARALATQKYQSEQLAFNHLCMTRYGNVKCGTFEFEDFPNRHWYDLTELDRGMMAASVISNDFSQSLSAKVSMLKSVGHWFINTDGSCRHSAVSDLIRRQ
ncbi:hypothetical protein Q1695_016431 [Nippostrongylus brasiliensis]|nr:hypothetical protein Q1695_016431 [Nippostrongylus brasiliensis]